MCGEIHSVLCRLVSCLKKDCTLSFHTASSSTAEAAAECSILPLMFAIQACFCLTRPSLGLRISSMYRHWTFLVKVQCCVIKYMYSKTDLDVKYLTFIATFLQHLSKISEKKTLWINECIPAKICCLLCFPGNHPVFQKTEVWGPVLSWIHQNPPVHPLQKNTISCISLIVHTSAGMICRQETDCLPEKKICM